VVRCPGLALAASVLVAALAACERDPPPKSWPPGTVLAVDEVPIGVDEVDLASVYVQRIEPAASPAQLRRQALANVALPRAIAAAIAPEERREARRQAEAKLAELRTGVVGPPKPDGAYGELRTAGWTELGIVSWGVATDLADGEWSEVIEEIGYFTVLRRLERHEAPVPMATRVTVDTFVFPWLDPPTLHQQVESAYDRCRLTIVDPQWRAIVPELTQHRMGARDR
jgi:hypothetical protein